MSIYNELKMITLNSLEDSYGRYELINNESSLVALDSTLIKLSCTNIAYMYMMRTIEEIASYTLLSKDSDISGFYKDLMTRISLNISLSGIKDKTSSKGTFETIIDSLIIPNASSKILGENWKRLHDVNISKLRDVSRGEQWLVFMYLINIFVSPETINGLKTYRSKFSKKSVVK